MDPALISTVNAFAFALVVTAAAGVLLKACFTLISSKARPGITRPRLEAHPMAPTFEHVAPGPAVEMSPLKKSTAKGAET